MDFILIFYFRIVCVYVWVLLDICLIVIENVMDVSLVLIENVKIRDRSFKVCYYLDNVWTCEVEGYYLRKKFRL